MHLKQLMLINTGPISRAVLDFPTRLLATQSADQPVSAETPLPVVLVGENGSGKSICLSHLVNALMEIQQQAYINPEVEIGQFYKLVGKNYIKHVDDFSFGRVVFDNGGKRDELVLNGTKEKYVDTPPDIPPDCLGLDGVAPGKWYHISAPDIPTQSLRDFFDTHCVLFFPSDRFEAPGWLNIQGGSQVVRPMNEQSYEGHTSRRIINHSPLEENQNWLFDVILDNHIHNIRVLSQDTDVGIQLPRVMSIPGRAKDVHDFADKVIQAVLQKKGEHMWFMLGTRPNRTFQVIRDGRMTARSLFQLSAGETALLDIFLSIVRDFDLTNPKSFFLKDIRGIVIVDEVDLHLHAVHQYEVLPALIQMFPRVQFILTSHSPLFVLGMRKLFGDDGFALYRLPEGRQISAEEFGEFENAYRAFTDTRRFTDEIQNQIRNSQKPILIAEGKTDIDYLRKAAELLGRTPLLDKVELKDGGGKSNLNAAWKFLKSSQAFEQEVILLYDCDVQGEDNHQGNVHKAHVLFRPEAPLQKGIENRFDAKTLKKAYKAEIGGVSVSQKKTRQGGKEKIDEVWDIDKAQKSALCEWLCQNGDLDDFRHFAEIFDMLEKILGPEAAPPSSPPPDKANGAA